MAGVSVRDVFFAFDCETIDLGYEQLREDELLPLLESFSSGQFTRVENLILTVSAAPRLSFNFYVCPLICVRFKVNALGDAAGELIGVGLKVNSSLLKLDLVRLFVCILFFVGSMRVRGWGSCAYAFAAEWKSNRRRWS